MLYLKFVDIIDSLKTGKEGQSVEDGHGLIMLVYEWYYILKKILGEIVILMELLISPPFLLTLFNVSLSYEDVYEMEQDFWSKWEK